MTGRASTTSGLLLRHRRWAGPAALAGLLGLVGLAGFAIGPYLFDPAVLEREIAHQIRATTGLVLTTKARAQFALFPQPHLTMGALHLADPTNSLAVDADALRGDVRMLPLLAGRLEISSASLVRPKINLDLDGGPIAAGSTIGNAFHAVQGLQSARDQRLGIVTLVDGSASIGRKSDQARTAFSHLNLTVDWRNLDAPASLTGTVEFKGTPIDVAAWMGLPSSLMRGDHSPIALHVQSPVLTVSANGALDGSPTLRFHGHVSANAPALRPVMALAGHQIPLPAPFSNVTLSSDTTISAQGVDLQTLHLQFDGNDYEGTLALHEGSGIPSLAGTLATENWSLSPFLELAPASLDKTRQWSAKPLPAMPPDRLSLDLRISATRLTLPPLAIDDAAVSVITRDDRTEIALIAGRAYGGKIKGRVSAGFAGLGLSLRGAASLTDADASALSWDIMGRQWAAGTLSATTNFETAGANPHDLAANLQGWAKGQIANGELSGIDIGHGLREIARNRPDTVLSALRNGRTPFETLALGLNLSGGVATIDDGNLRGPDARAAVTGKADIGARQFDLNATTTAPATDATVPPPHLDFGIAGSFDQPVIAPQLASEPRP